MQVELTDMAYGGDAVGRDPDSGIAVFAWPGISGEQVTVDPELRRPNLVRGLVTAVEKPSPLRLDPPCPYFGACGGCQWQHIEYEGQLAFKHNILRSQLARRGGIADPDGFLLAPLPSPQSFGYRNTSQFAVDPQTGSLAYFRRGSHHLFAVDVCPISNSGINRLIPKLNSLLKSTPQDILAQEPRGVMRLWKIAVRHSEATGQTVIVLHTRPGGKAGMESPQQAPKGRRRRGDAQVPERPDEGPNMDVGEEANPVFLLKRRDVKRALPALAALEGQDAPAALSLVEVMDDGTINLLGATRTAGSITSEAMAEALTGSYLGDMGRESALGSGAPPLGSWIESLGGQAYWVAPGAFFQVNSAGAELILEEVLAGLPDEMDLLVDAHSGVGTFALALAGRAERVVAFETESAASASARWTAISRSITNVEFKQGRAEALMRTLPAEVRPDAVVLDPPRSGCHPGLLREIARREVPRIVYISCDPGTLAGDLKLLADNYTLKSARVIDMFPQTYHIETVAVLDRTGS